MSKNGKYWSIGLREFEGSKSCAANREVNVEGCSLVGFATVSFYVFDGNRLVVGDPNLEEGKSGQPPGRADGLITDDVQV